MLYRGNETAIRGRGPADPNVFAWVIVQVITGQPTTPPDPAPATRKHEPSVGMGLGRLAAMKRGGKAR